MGTVRRAVDLARTLRGQAGLRLRQPLRQLWLAVPGGRLARGRDQEEANLLDLLTDETNVKQVVLIGDEFGARRAARQAAAAQDRQAPRRPDAGRARGRAGQRGRVPAPTAASDLAGVELGADEVEILATPRSGTAVAHDYGIVVVIDTEIDDELRAEGDARELQRAIQDLRKQVGLEPR